LAADDFLTPSDKLLLQREFDAPEPENLPGLVDKLPPGTPLPTILYRYLVRPKGGMQNRHLRPFIRCAHCKGKRHWKGFVIELEDESLALLGHKCGREQFGIDFRRVEADFHSARNRQDDLKRVIELRALFPAFEQELGGLVRLGALGVFDTYMQAMRNFGMFRYVLQEAARHNEGVLTCRAVERNREEEQRRAERLPLYKHHTQRVSGAQTAYDRRKRVEDMQQWLKSLPPVEIEKFETIGRMVGGGIFNIGLNASLARDVQGPRNLLAAQIDEFMSTRSDHWTKRRLISAVNKLRQGVGLMYRGLGVLQELDKFTAPENLALIARWSRREIELPLPRVPFPLKASGRALTDEDDRFRLALPANWALPVTPHMNALARALGAVGDD
jgi:hypothetical protein